MNESFNNRLCNEKHKEVDRRLDVVEGEMRGIDTKVDKIRTWLIASLTALCLNLIGVACLLVITLIRV